MQIKRFGNLMHGSYFLKLSHLLKLNVTVVRIEQRRIINREMNKTNITQ